MRKITLVLLALCLVFGFAACGASPADLTEIESSIGAMKIRLTALEGENAEQKTKLETLEGDINTLTSGKET